MENAENKSLVAYFVLYHEEKGIYLGSDHWSKVNPGKKTHAPAYTRQVADDLIATSLHYAGCQPYPVFPDKHEEHCYASVEACANGMLPAWKPES